MRQRLHYFDMLKGLAIFMVVMGHVITFCVREIDRTALFKIIAAIHMPLFFFISGWMTGSSTKAPALGKRALQLLVPMLACSSLWILYFPHSGLGTPFDSSFAGLWTDKFKNGYWFTLVLFEIIAIYAAVRPILHRSRSRWIEIVVYGILTALFLYLYGKFENTMACRVLSWQFVAEFFPVFAFGVMAARRSDTFLKLIATPAVSTAALIVLALSLYAVRWPWDIPFLGTVSLAICNIAMQISLAVVALAVVIPWSAEAYAPDASGHRLARMWSYIGTQSLTIYLLHYFFLFPMGWARPWLEASALGFIPAFVLSCATAAVIVAVMLCLNRILKVSPLLAWLLGGHLPPFLKKKTKPQVANG